MGWRRWCWRSSARREGAGATPLLLHVARDDRRLEALAEGLAFFAPKVRVIQMPGLGHGALRPHRPQRRDRGHAHRALARLAAVARKGPTVVLTTVNAILQRLPPREFIRRSLKTIAPGQRIDMNQLVQRLSLAGFQRTGTVMEPGEYAVRGGILDLFPPGRSTPVRLDFFGDTLEHIKAFDPETQRTGKIVQRLTLMPISEVAFGGEAEKRFRAQLRRDVRPGHDRGRRCTRPSAPASAIPAWSTGCRCSTISWRRCSTTCRRRARQLRPPGRAGSRASGSP